MEKHTINITEINGTYPTTIRTTSEEHEVQPIERRRLTHEQVNQVIALIKSFD